MERKPLIGISGSLMTIDSGAYLGFSRSFVVHNFVEAVEKAGGIPIILPVLERLECIKDQIRHLDGLILSGGHDIQPQFYGQEPLPGLANVCFQRDVYEIALVKEAFSKKIPILGICRGIQVLNVAFGGTLVQDLESEEGFCLQHMQHAKPYNPSHTVDIVENTHLHTFLGCDVVLTNSFHHQAVNHIPLGFKVSARARDGIVEGIEREGDQIVMGVQWHPEFMVHSSPWMMNLFSHFVKQSIKS